MNYDSDDQKSMEEELSYREHRNSWKPDTDDELPFEIRRERTRTLRWEELIQEQSRTLKELQVKKVN